MTFATFQNESFSLAKRLQRSEMGLAISVSASESVACFSAASAADAPKHKILFFSKSSGFEHSVISYKTGQPSYAEKILMDLGAKNNRRRRSEPKPYDFRRQSTLSREHVRELEQPTYLRRNLCIAGLDDGRRAH